MKSRKISKVRKINFLLSEWVENWSKCNFLPKILYKTLKTADFSHFWGFFAIFVVFDHICTWPNMRGPAYKKSSKSSWITSHTFRTLPGRPGFYWKWENFFHESHFRFSKFFALKNLVMFVLKNCKNSLSVSLKS